MGFAAAGTLAYTVPQDCFLVGLSVTSNGMVLSYDPTMTFALYSALAGVFDNKGLIATTPSSTAASSNNSMRVPLKKGQKIYGAAIGATVATLHLESSS